MIMVDETTVSRIVLVRHADRFDYANPLWGETAAFLGFNHRDSPLSSLGFMQADEVGQELKRLADEWGGVDAVLCSPYLRVIQTASPFAELSGKRLELEEGLAETRHAPGLLPSAAERWQYLPQVALKPEFGPSGGEGIFPASDIKPDVRFNDIDVESYPHGYQQRMLRVAECYSEAFRGKTVVCFSHAASIALVSALTGDPLDESVRFAPAGIFVLNRAAGSNKPWVLMRSGGTNEYLSRTVPTTSAWGFTGTNLEMWNARLQEWKRNKREDQVGSTSHTCEKIMK